MSDGVYKTEKDIAEVSWVEVDFDPDPGYQLLFAGLHGYEELGRPFFFEVELSSGSYRADLNKIVGTSGTVWLSQKDANKQDRYFNGVVTRVVSLGMKSGAYHYRAELRPWIWLLTRTVDCKIFQNLSPFKIITQVFRDANFSDFEDKRQASAGDTPTLEYCVQYRESSFDFVTRLMEQYGIYYFFKHEKGKHTLVLCDDPNCHDKLSDAIPFAFQQTERRTADDHVWEWATELLLESGKFTFRDYNFTTPSADLTAKSVKPGDQTGYKDFEVYDYPGPYDDTSSGQALTDIRMQAIARHRIVSEAVSNARGPRAGWTFTLSDHPESSVNREYLIVRSEVTLTATEGGSKTGSDGSGETLDSYRVSLRCIPNDVPFRLERWTPWPMIRGPQTAKVVGASGDEITTDQYGRVKVKFHWDRSDAQDDTASCWIRVAQSWGGAGWGSIFIPRVGQEVVVEFLEGNPDRPLITGVVYNATNTVPYALPDNKTRSTLKTNSSTGGSGFNELRFEDKAGSEEVFFQAQKDFNKKVLNNETISVKQDHTTTIEQGNHKTTVSQGNHELTVSQGNQTTTVSSGNHKLDVSAGKSEITAAQSITLTVGGNSIKIDTSGITINGTKIDMTAQASASLTGATVSVTGNGSVSVSAPSVAIN